MNRAATPATASRSDRCRLLPRRNWGAGFQLGDTVVERRLAIDARTGSPGKGFKAGSVLGRSHGALTGLSDFCKCSSNWQLAI